ncbi:MAG: ribose-5-phosphate isomerase RpiA [Acidobacteria bacterium]|nr:ribose-5-phosphate isomerase RpiA [Acidobacteriota bacterium]
MSVDHEKQRAARAAADLVERGMRVGLGTGSTVAFLLVELARRRVSATYVATSPHTARAAREHGIEVDSFASLDRLDLAIDGADQVAPDGWLIKGAGGALTREKIVAASADRFVVIVDASKMVAALSAPVPLELSRFGLVATLRRLGATELRDAPPSPDGGVLADHFALVTDPAALSARLSDVPGVVAHGLFSPSLVDEVIVGRGDECQRLRLGGTP